MKPLIICVSIHHGNTLKVAHAMAEELGAKVLKPSNVSPADIRSADLIGLGSGIYLGAHHRSLIKLVKSNADLFRGKPTFIFYTSAVRKFRLFNRCDEALKHELAKAGARLIGVFSCPGFCDYGPWKLIGGVNKGRPNERDLLRARDFAREIAARL